MPAQSPKYSTPPIREVSYSLQFEPIASLHVGYLGAIWGEFREDFPAVENGEEFSHEIERFGSRWTPQRVPRIQFLEEARSPRMIMKTASGDRRLQAQRDKLIFNWVGDGTKGEYPGFNALAHEYEGHLSKLERFVSSNSELGAIKFNQAEVTKINHIPVDGLSLTDLVESLTFKSDIFPEQKLESCNLSMSHHVLVDGEPIGRLYSRLGREFRLSDGTPIYVIHFTARANLLDNTHAGALDMLHFLCDKINHAFEALTTDKAKFLWGKGSDK